MELKGTVVEVGEEQQITDSFKKREFIVQYSDNPDYTELIRFECVQKNVSLLDQVAEGDEVTVQFNLKGRRGRNEQVYNSLHAWKIVVTDV